MEHIPSIINTIILIAIFWYQKNKNQILIYRINEQSSLLKETNDVVNKLSQAVDSQKTVVDTALEYSKAFDINKLESIIKREIELDYKEILKVKEDEYKEKISVTGNNNGINAQIIEKSVNNTAQFIAQDYIVPLSIALYKSLYLKNATERKDILKEIPEHISEFLQSRLEENEKANKEMETEPNFVKVR